MHPDHPVTTSSEAGFTLIEIAIAVGLISTLTLALVEMNTLSARAVQSSNTTDEFNEEVSLLISLLNSKGCTAAFTGMPIDTNSNLPVISPMASSLPSPSPLAAFTTFIANANAPIGIYTQPSSSPSPTPHGVVLQVTAPSAQTATAYFPPPLNHLWVTKLAFTQRVDNGFMTSLNNPGWTANLYNLHLDAQKTSTGQTLLGGQTTFSKDFLVTLWVANNQVVYCGPTPQ